MGARAHAALRCAAAMASAAAVATTQQQPIVAARARQAVAHAVVGEVLREVEGREVDAAAVIGAKHYYGAVGYVDGSWVGDGGRGWG
jgi:hypothetical protein